VGVTAGSREVPGRKGLRQNIIIIIIMHTDRRGNTRRQKCREKEAEKKLKYNSLGIEIQRMWNLKCTIIPVIIGATGIVTNSLRKTLEAIPGKHSIDSLQKTAILGTSHIIRKVLHLKPERWGSPLVQEKYQEEKACDKRQQRRRRRRR
jgi:hypothetical protein